jgi:DNA-binding NtrC family response regulator
MPKAFLQADVSQVATWSEPRNSEREARVDDHRRTQALVVEDDEGQRTLVAMLLESSNMDVLECESAEDAISILDQNGTSVCFLFTDVKLAGAMTGTALAFEVDRRFPNIDIVVTSGAFPVEHLPANAKFISKPWRGLDILNAAQHAITKPEA